MHTYTGNPLQVNFSPKQLRSLLVHLVIKSSVTILIPNFSMPDASLQAAFMSSFPAIGLFLTTRSLKRLLVREDPSLGYLDFCLFLHDPDYGLEKSTIWRKIFLPQSGTLYGACVSCASYRYLPTHDTSSSYFIQRAPKSLPLHAMWIGGLHHYVRSKVAWRSPI